MFCLVDDSYCSVSYSTVALFEGETKHQKKLLLGVSYFFGTTYSTKKKNYSFVIDVRLNDDDKLAPARGKIRTFSVSQSSTATVNSDLPLQRPTYSSFELGSSISQSDR